MKAPKPVTAFLGKPGEDLSREEAIRVAREVREMIATPGWQHILAAAKECNRFEQTMLMREGAGAEAAQYERTVGRWNGRLDTEAFAEAIVKRGEQVTAEYDRAAERSHDAA